MRGDITLRYKQTGFTDTIGRPLQAITWVGGFGNTKGGIREIPTRDYQPRLGLKG